MLLRTSQRPWVPSLLSSQLLDPRHELSPLPAPAGVPVASEAVCSEPQWHRPRPASRTLLACSGKVGQPRISRPTRPCSRWAQRQQVGQVGWKPPDPSSTLPSAQLMSCGKGSQRVTPSIRASPEVQGLLTVGGRVVASHEWLPAVGTGSARDPLRSSSSLSHPTVNTFFPD